ncbi:hypothetical protein Tco_0117822 [Tanacetum coccineum]
MWLTATAAADGGGEGQANDGDGITTWEKTFPRKVNIFMWRLNLDRLPHRFNLSSRGIDIPEISSTSCNADIYRSERNDASRDPYRATAQLVCVYGVMEEDDMLDGSVAFSLLIRNFHTLSQNGSSIVDYYHKLNALWKQFDALIELPRCTCHTVDDFKKHNQLMKLMQFLMGLDDTYMQIRSFILSRETLPDIMSAYAIISSEESYRDCLLVDPVSGNLLRLCL